MEVERPERFERSAFWFVVGKPGDPKALQVSHLRAAPSSRILPQLVHKLVHMLFIFVKTSAVFVGRNLALRCVMSKIDINRSRG